MSGRRALLTSGVIGVGIGALFKVYKIASPWEEPPLCLKCKWFVVPSMTGAEFGRCFSPENGKRMSDGGVIDRYASLNREYQGPFTRCGPRGDWFEPKAKL